jgi:hypothetical protein
MEEFLASAGWNRVVTYLTESAKAIMGELMNPGNGERAMYLAGQLKQLNAAKIFPEDALRVLKMQNKYKNQSDEEAV